MKQFSDLSPQAGNVSIFSVKLVFLLAIGDHMIFGNDTTFLLKSWSEQHLKKRAISLATSRSHEI